MSLITESVHVESLLKFGYVQYEKPHVCCREAKTRRTGHFVEASRRCSSTITTCPFRPPRSKVKVTGDPTGPKIRSATIPTGIPRMSMPSTRDKISPCRKSDSAALLFGSNASTTCVVRLLVRFSGYVCIMSVSAPYPVVPILCQTICCACRMLLNAYTRKVAKTSMSLGMPCARATRQTIPTPLVGLFGAVGLEGRIVACPNQRAHPSPCTPSRL